MQLCESDIVDIAKNIDKYNSFCDMLIVVFRESSGGWGEDEARPLIRVSVFSLRQCFDAVGWLTGRASGLEKICPTYPTYSVPEQLKKKKLRSNWLICDHLENIG